MYLRRENKLLKIVRYEDTEGNILNEIPDELFVVVLENGNKIKKYTDLDIVTDEYAKIAEKYGGEKKLYILTLNDYDADVVVEHYKDVELAYAMEALYDLQKTLTYIYYVGDVSIYEPKEKDLLEILDNLNKMFNYDIPDYIDGDNCDLNYKLFKDYCVKHNIHSKLPSEIINKGIEESKMIQKQNPHLRYGQCIFNHFSKYPIGESLRGTDKDPFYDDSKVNLFINSIS